MSRDAQLRRRAKELLGDKSVVMVLGYKQAKQTCAVQPAFITRPEDADKSSGRSASESGSLDRTASW